MRQLKVYNGHEYVIVKPNAAGIVSPILILEPPANSFFDFKRIFTPVIALADSAGELIDPGSTVSFAMQRANEQVPTYLPGVFALQDFNDLTTAQQRNADNRQTLTQDLGLGALIQEQDRLLINLKSPDVVDWTKSTVEFPVLFSAA